LEREGWQLDRARDSHHVFRHPDRRYRIVVPVTAGELRRGTLASILEATELRPRTCVDFWSPVRACRAAMTFVRAFTAASLGACSVAPRFDDGSRSSIDVQPTPLKRSRSNPSPKSLEFGCGFFPRSDGEGAQLRRQFVAQ